LGAIWHYLAPFRGVFNNGVMQREIRMRGLMSVSGPPGWSTLSAM